MIEQSSSWNILIVGLGNVGLGYDLKNESSLLTHVKSIKKMAQLLKLNLVLHAIEPEVSKRIIFKSKYPNDHVYESVNFVLLTKFDLAIICCNTELIVSTCLDVLSKFKIKKILLEKPVTNKITAFENFAWQIDSNTEVLVGFPRRTLPSSYFIKECIESNFQSGEWEISMEIYGDILNIGIHFLDLIYYFYGSFDISNFVKDCDLVTFKGVGNNFTLNVSQKSKVNEEKSNFYIKGPIQISYEEAGRRIAIGGKGFYPQMLLGSKLEIEQMIGFESMDYLNWMLNRNTSKLPSLFDTPLKELLSKGAYL